MPIISMCLYHFPERSIASKPAIPKDMLLSIFYTHFSVVDFELWIVKKVWEGSSCKSMVNSNAVLIICSVSFVVIFCFLKIAVKGNSIACLHINSYQKKSWLTFFCFYWKICKSVQGSL